MNFASLFRSFYCAHKEMLYSLLAMRYIFKEYNTIYFEFFTKGPHLFYVIANTKEGGGLLVATTMAIHLEEPVISAS